MDLFKLKICFVTGCGVNLKVNRSVDYLRLFCRKSLRGIYHWITGITMAASRLEVLVMFFAFHRKEYVEILDSLQE